MNTHIVRVRNYDWEVLKNLARHLDRTVGSTMSLILREWLDQNATKHGFKDKAIERLKSPSKDPSPRVK